MYIWSLPSLEWGWRIFQPRWVFLLNVSFDTDILSVRSKWFSRARSAVLFRRVPRLHTNISLESCQQSPVLASCLVYDCYIVLTFLQLWENKCPIWWRPYPLAVVLRCELLQTVHGVGQPSSNIKSCLECCFFLPIIEVHDTIHMAI